MNMRILFFQKPSHPTPTCLPCSSSHVPLWRLGHSPQHSHYCACVGAAERCTTRPARGTFPFGCPWSQSLSLLGFISYPHVTGGELGFLSGSHRPVEPCPASLGSLPGEASAFPNHTAELFPEDVACCLYGLHVSPGKERTTLFTLKSRSLKLTWYEPRANSKNSWISMASSGEKAKTM